MFKKKVPWRSPKFRGGGGPGQTEKKKKKKEIDISWDGFPYSNTLHSKSYLTSKISNV